MLEFVFSYTSLVAFAILLLHFYYKNKFSYWTRKGFKGPRPWPLVGNVIQLLGKNTPANRKKWALEYGKCYGVFMGSRPCLAINDLEIVRQVCIADFDVFPNHHHVSPATDYQRNFITSIRSENWKRVRALQTPTFTSGKIKRMYKLMQACVDDLLLSTERQLREKSSGPEDKRDVIHLKDLFSLFTLDAITACCYGLRIERGPDVWDIKSAAAKGGLARAALKVFEFRQLRILIFFMMPQAILEFLNFTLSPASDHEPLAKITEALIEKRRFNESGKKYDDYLQILVDARLGEELQLSELDDRENHHADLSADMLIEDQKKMVEEASSNSKGKKLEELELISNAMFLLAVGLETTAGALTNTTYILAYHPDIQQKLYEELVKILDPKTDSFSYEDLTANYYLDSVISEALRYLSPIQNTDREAERDYFFEKLNLSIEKGTQIMISMSLIHKDPDYWPEPEKFDPERFMPGRREKIIPGSYFPFGLGPRHCLGMRFSLTETKLALAKIMMKYRFEKAPGTTFPPPSESTLGVLKITTPYVKFIERTPERSPAI